MNQFNKDIIAALSSDKDITLNEVLRRQIEVAANQFLQNELTAVLGYEPHTRIDRSKRRRELPERDVHPNFKAGGAFFVRRIYN